MFILRNLDEISLISLPKYHNGLSNDCHQREPTLVNPPSPVLLVCSLQVISEVVVMATALHSVGLPTFLRHLDMQSWRLFVDDWLNF